MPSADDGGEWSNWCSNVVCVRTKSSKESENSSDGPSIRVEPIVLRSTYREDPASSSAAVGLSSAPLPPRVVQRRRLTRLIQTTPLHYSALTAAPIQYEGVGRVLLNLKVPSSSVSSSTFYTSTSRPPPSSSSSWSAADVISRPPFFPPPRRRSSPVRIVLKREPVDDQTYRRHDHLNSDFRSSSSSLLHSSRRDLRPTFTPPSPSSSSYVRASSLPPFLSTPYVRRSSVAVPGYSATSGYGGRSIGSADTGSVTSSLRRGSVDVSYLSSRPDFLKSPSYSRQSVAPVVRSEVGPRSNYRRGSLSVPRSTFRSSSVGRFSEDELKAFVPLSLPPSETLSSLRSRTQKAKDKLDTQRSLLDRYLPGGSREPSIDTRFDINDRSASRRSSLSTASSLRGPTLTGSRAPSMDRSNNDDLSSTSAAALHSYSYSSSSYSRAPPPTPNNMSPARRRIRNVLYKVSGDEDFLN